MAALLFLFLASAPVGAVRVVNEEMNVRCALLEHVYIDARNKMEDSVKHGGNLSDPRNMDHLLRAARSLKKALKIECDWAKDLPKTSHEGDAPFLSKQMHSKLAEHPCGDQALAIAKTGNLKEAMQALMAEGGECPATSHITKGEGNPYVAGPEVPSVPVVQDAVNDDARTPLLTPFNTQAEKVANRGELGPNNVNRHSGSKKKRKKRDASKSDFRHPQSLRAWAVQALGSWIRPEVFYILLIIFFPLGVIPLGFYALVVGVHMLGNLFRLAH
eukprot:TRINITY_DN3457_c0_g2_i1.p1 TRINITY_DN3457_c0_g2~~TRINITY_DN3457_c0_g2_i1.p1  ORF type:complete len:273 (+),score=19.88 TRINITY_DN3457_c0_g2_i1:51-869(+)